MGLFWAVLGPSWAVPGPSWAVLAGLGRLGALWGLSWGPPVASRGPLGALLGTFRDPLGSLLGRLGALLGSLGTLLGASWAVLGRSWRPLGPSWSVGKPKRRICEKCAFYEGNGPIFASGDPLGTHLGGLLGRLRGVLGRQEAILSVLERSGAVWMLSWAVLGVLSDRPGALVGGRKFRSSPEFAESRGGL